MSEWGGRAAQALQSLVLATYGTTCHLCSEPIRFGLPPRHPDGPSTDHLIPRSKGGSDDLGNLRPAHYGCNSARGADNLAELLPEHDGRAFFSAADHDGHPAPVPFSPRWSNKTPSRPGADR